MRTKPQPRLYTHRTVARLLGVNTETLRDWVAAGEFPKPLATIRRTLLYSAAAVDRFTETGVWAEQAGIGRRRAKDP